MSNFGRIFSSSASASSGSGGSSINTGAGGNFKSATSPIAAAAVSKSILFNSSMSAATYVVLAQLNNLTDSGPQQQPTMPGTVKATTGFTAIWENPTDSANYVLEWIVVAPFNT